MKPDRYRAQSPAIAARTTRISRTSKAVAPGGPTSPLRVRTARQCTKLERPSTNCPDARALSSCETAVPVTVTHQEESAAAAPQGRNQLPSVPRV